MIPRKMSAERSKGDRSRPEGVLPRPGVSISLIQEPDSNAYRDTESLLRHHRERKRFLCRFTELRHPVGGQSAGPQPGGEVRVSIVRTGARGCQTDSGRTDTVQLEQGNRAPFHGVGEPLARDRLGGRGIDPGWYGL